MSLIFPDLRRQQAEEWDPATKHVLMVDFEDLLLLCP